MMNFISNAALVILFVMVIVQAPLFYYYTSGILAAFYFIPFFVVELLLVIGLFVMLRKMKGLSFQRVGLRVAIGIAIFTIAFGQRVLENFDWMLRRGERTEIVQWVKDGRLRPNVPNSKVMCTLPGWNFPPISNGGNQIAIHRRVNQNTMLVEFYIDRGFLDHYSAFVYTDDPAAMEDFNKIISSKNDTREVTKIEAHWYKVYY